MVLLIELTVIDVAIGPIGLVQALLASLPADFLPALAIALHAGDAHQEQAADDDAADQRTAQPS